MVTNSPGHLAHQLNDRLGLKLTAQPWNRYTPTDTFYWLVPSTEWPVYKFGKLASSLSHDVPRKPLLGLDDRPLAVDRMFAGLNVEKGYGAVASIVNPVLGKKKRIIDPTWCWFSVVDGDGPKTFARTISTTAKASRELHLYVIAGPVHDREDHNHPPHDAMLFSCDQTARLTAVVDNGFPIPVLKGLETSADFPTLASRLRKIDDYHWVDLYLGAYVDPSEDPRHLYDRLLSYFDVWLIRSGKPTQPTRCRE